MQKVEMETVDTEWIETILFRIEKKGVTYAVLFCTKCPHCCRLELPKDEKQLAPKKCEKHRKEMIAPSQCAL